MGLEINLTPDDIDRLVKDSIMKAGFGKAIEEGVKRAIAPGYDNPIEKAMKAYVIEVADNLLRTKFADQIKEIVTTYINQNVTGEVLEKITNVSLTEMIVAAKRC